VPGGEDRRAAIDRRLDETFGAFDAAVRATQEQIARERAAQEAQGGANGTAESSGEAASDDVNGEGEGGAGSGTRGGLESVGTGSGGTEAEGDGNAGDGAEKGGGTGTGGSTGSGPREIPPDIPDGSDDDVVARQIREAAMKETDPELRAALWEEYRKYKKGQ
jgi:hypothetical protein